MSFPAPPVIVYRYDASPYSIKIDNILLLKNIPYRRVNVSSVLPRPDISELLGITYRRIPILAIGNDVYCDTSLIATALETRFPPTAGYGSIFPPAKHGGATDTGLVKAFAKLYEATLFPPATTLIPWERFPAAFVSDRSALSGAPIDVQGIVASRKKSLTTLASHLSFLEEQFQDGREWLFDSELPSLADISVHFILYWAGASRPGKPLISVANFPHTLGWLTRVSNYLERKRGTHTASAPITGGEAATAIVSSAHQPYNIVGFNEQEAEHLGLKHDDQVQVAPDDSGRNYPTDGKLVGINRDEVVIEVQGSEGLVRCHFPRLGFTVKATRSKL